ncbi:TauD/TfdA family dioxygenase [Pinirhizobacter soli]|uniref:TauD/TfdA family dioxygenase n=2 Tax=Pinirhizobacter soli TaxID=2786953 RepID=UPI002029C22C
MKQAALPSLHRQVSITPLASFGALVTPAHSVMDYLDLPVDHLRALARHSKIVLLRGFTNRFSGQALADYARHWGRIMTGSYGDVLDLVEKEESHDSIFDSLSLPLHWDGMYMPTIPEFQVFHCADAGPLNTGGETVFVDTVGLLEHAGASVRDTWRAIETTSCIRAVSHYGGSVRSALVVEHPVHHVPTLRYSPPVDAIPGFRNPNTVIYEGLDQASMDESIALLHRCLAHPAHRYEHAWRTGDVLIADNLALLHGRNAFVHGSKRHLQRVHIHADPVLINTGFFP